MSWRVTKLKTIENRPVTLGEFFDALERNGLPQARFTYWDKRVTDNEETVEAACAIGQAALNLGADYNDLESALRKISRVRGGPNLSHSIIERNDRSGWTIQKIAQHYRKAYAEKLSERFDLDISYHVEKE